MTGFCVSTFLRLEDVGSCAVSGIGLAITSLLLRPSAFVHLFLKTRIGEKISTHHVGASSDLTKFTHIARSVMHDSALLSEGWFPEPNHQISVTGGALLADFL